MKQVVYILILGQDMGDQSICCSTRLDRAIVSCVGVGGGMREGAVGFFFFFFFLCSIYCLQYFLVLYIYTYILFLLNSAILKNS